MRSTLPFQGFAKYVPTETLGSQHAVVSSSCHLDEWRAAKEEAEQVGANVVADHNGDGHDEPEKQNFITTIIFSYPILAMFKPRSVTPPPRIVSKFTDFIQ